MARRDVETHVLANAGARPWDRDADDIRVLFFIAEGRGTIIDDEKEVSAYAARVLAISPNYLCATALHSCRISVHFPASTFNHFEGK